MPRARKTSVYKSTESDVRRRNAIFIVWAFIACLIIVTGAILLGKSDSGQIDINSVIRESNQTRQATQEDGTEVRKVEEIPEVFRNQKNGGLVPTDTPTETRTPPTETVSEESATTTETESELEGESEVETETELQGEETEPPEVN